MDLRSASLVTTVLTLPTTLSAFLLPSSVCRGCCATQHAFSAARDAAAFRSITYNSSAGWKGAQPLTKPYTRLRLKKDDLPEETLRQLEAADERVKDLEEEYRKSLDADEVVIERKCASGLACLKMGMLERSAEDYTAAAELSRPSSRTWPLGLVLFYLGRYEEAAVRLDTDIRYFETQFEECATDERIWQAAAMIRGAREAGADVEQVAAGLPPLQIPERNALRRTVYRMFRGEDSPEDVKTVAKLEAGGLDFLGIAFFSDLFLGLWHDACGNEVEAEKYVLEACRSRFPQPDDLWYHTPRVHAKARGWELREG